MSNNCLIIPWDSIHKSNTWYTEWEIVEKDNNTTPSNTNSYFAILGVILYIILLMIFFHKIKWKPGI